jgi:hypothetical protein
MYGKNVVCRLWDISAIHVSCIKGISHARFTNRLSQKLSVSHKRYWPAPIALVCPEGQEAGMVADLRDSIRFGTRYWVSKGRFDNVIILFEAWDS